MMKQVIVLLALLLSACGNNKSQQIELDRLKAERAAAEQTRSVLAARGAYDIEVMVSSGLINQVLAGASKITYAPPQVPGLQLMVDTVSATFTPGVLALKLGATATKLGLAASIAVTIDAGLVPTITGDEIQLRPVVRSVHPEIRAGSFEFADSSLLDDLGKIALADLATKLPSISIPMSHAFSVMQPGAVRDITIDTGNGSSIRGNLTTPTAAVGGAVTVKNVVILDNGLHVLANVEGI